MLPKSVINDINKVLKGFLWCQGDLTRGKAKIDWKYVCKPKDEGGLGIKDFMSKHLWNVASQKEPLWVKWINVVRLKGSSVWTVDHDKCSSYGWKQILKLRDKMRNHMVCKIGNGASIFLWHDRWWGPDPLSKYISMNDVEQAGFDCNMKIKDMINEGQWSWSTEWSNSFPIVQSITVPTLLNDSNDRYL